MRTFLLVIGYWFLCSHAVAQVTDRSGVKDVVVVCALAGLINSEQ